MHRIYKNTRDWLITASRTNFYNVITEAKMTPRQKEIVEERFIKGKPNFLIAMDMNLSTKTIEREIHMAYLAINRILNMKTPDPQVL